MSFCRALSSPISNRSTPVKLFPDRFISVTALLL